MRRTLAPIALLLPMLVQAAPAHLVHDTDPTPVPGSSLMGAVAGGGPGGAVFFLVEKPAPGAFRGETQLWRCDASGQNPLLLRDRLVHASDLIVFDGRLSFNGDDGIHGGEPWTSDGTAAGTRMIADVVPGGLGSYPYNWVPLGAAVYFVNHAGGEGRLWKTDLAGSGVAPVFAVPSEDGGPSRVATIVRSGDSLFGWFDDGIHGLEPWRTDGTREGSRLVADVYPGEPGSFAGEVVDLDGVVLFPALEPEVGVTLWRAGDAQEGATRLHTVSPQRMRRLGSRVYFLGFDPATGGEPWQTDGTPASTHLVADLVPGPEGSFPFEFRAAGSTVYFSPYVPDLGRELWKVLPGGGAALVKEVWPGTESGIPYALDARPVGDRLVFRADDGVHGAELWTTDGTAEGTVLLRDVKPGPSRGVESNSSVGGFRVASGNLYFLGDDGVIGREPWRSDGTPEGTVPVGDLNPAMGTASGNVRGLVAAGAAAYFKADPSDVWRTDGTSPGTRRLRTDVAAPLVAAGNRVVFSASDAEHGHEVWASDLEGSTVAPLDLRPGPQSSYAQVTGSVGSRALVLGFQEDTYGVWGTDGTEQGTVSLGSYQEVSWNTMTAAPGGVSLLGLNDGVAGLEPWATDGTIEGTRLLADLVPGPDSSYPFGYAASGQTISFFAFESSGAEKLWVSDGTTEGTVEIAGGLWSDTVPREDSLAIAGGAAFFADERAPSFGLWRTEGAGVALVAEVADASPGVFLGVGDLLYFTVRRAGPDGIVHELWRSDGTTWGTFPLASFSHPQPPVFLGEVEGVVLFSASQGSGPFPGVHGLWRSDGTAAGTRKVQDITAGPVVTLGTHAYFPADDGIVGMELWSARPSILAGKATLALEELRAELDAVGLPRGIARSLRAKLAPGGRAGLEAFLRELDALPAKVLEGSAAESLRGFAVEILELLSVP